VGGFFGGGGLFFVAGWPGGAGGFGGVAFGHVVGEGLAEVKRMYVRPEARGRGVARAIMSRLEAEARGRGAEKLVLETGDAQRAAIRFYQRAGFARRAAFGVYASMGLRAVERCVFFEKTLVDK
jgi:putative acetyltransferase